MSSPNEPHQFAIEFRDELLEKGWPDDRHLAKLIGMSSESAFEQYAAHARTAGLLLGVWSEVLRGFVYPEFQFDRLGKLRPEVSELLSILPSEGDRGGWRRAFWLYSPHALLDGQLPAWVFATDSASVLKVAREEFDGDRDTGW
jgi:hypothetical protein